MPKGLSGRTVLHAGFGVVILLLAFTATEAYRIQDTVSERHLEFYREYMKQEAALSRLRRTIWLAGNHVRDFFLSTRPGRDSVLKEQLAQVEAESREALEQLETLKVLDLANPRLKPDLTEFWNTLRPVARTMLHATDAQEFEFVQREISPRRVNLYLLLRDLTDADQKAVQLKEADFSHTRRSAGQRLILMLGLCVVMALLVARFSLKYAGNLEKETERQYDEMTQAKRELEQLSARLLEIEEVGKKRLARELHDEIGQTLAVLQIEITHALALAGDRAPARERLMRARDLAERTVQTVRNISLLLRPALLDDLGLVPALQWYLEEFIRRSGIACEFSEEGVEDGLPEPVKISVYRIVQEALHNCEKHARASHVRVALRQAAGVLTVHIEDNGCGFALAPNGRPAGGGGLGILGMRERSARVNGTLVLESAPQHGTRLVLTVPIPAAPAAAPVPAMAGRA